MNTYQVKQLDTEGHVLSERQVEAQDYFGAVRQLSGVIDQAQRIEVYNKMGKKAGEISVDYWRQNVRRG